ESCAGVSTGRRFWDGCWAGTPRGVQGYGGVGGGGGGGGGRASALLVAVATQVELEWSGSMGPVRRVVFPPVEARPLRRL
ncbi:hypothetical protein KI387_020229, partial [Taxus chinensis]